MNLLNLAYIEKNPFDKADIDQTVLKNLIVSITNNPIPDLLVLRVRPHPTNGEYYQLLEGKHRLEALTIIHRQKEDFKYYRHPVEIVKATDSQMFQYNLVANFIRRTTTDAELVLLIKTVRDELVTNPNLCSLHPTLDVGNPTSKEFGRGGVRTGCRAGKHGSSRCIARILGVLGFTDISFQKISELDSKAKTENEDGTPVNETPGPKHEPVKPPVSPIPPSKPTPGGVKDSVPKPPGDKPMTPPAAQPAKDPAPTGNKKPLEIALSHFKDAGREVIKLDGTPAQLREVVNELARG